MNHNDLLGRRVLLTILAPHQQNKEILPRIRGANFAEAFTIAAKVVDYDTHGLWIECHDYPLYNEELKKRERQLAHILVKYQYISSIAAFPKIKAGDDQKIGFDSHHS